MTIDTNAIKVWKMMSGVCTHNRGTICEYYHKNWGDCKLETCPVITPSFASKLKEKPQPQKPFTSSK